MDRKPMIMTMPILARLLPCLLALALAPLTAQHPDLESPDPEKRQAARAALEARLVSEARQLTFEGRRAGEGYYRLDGTKMVFQSERHPGNPWYQIYVLDFETGDVTRVSPGQGKTTCAFLHPTEDEVLYASTHADPESMALQEEEIAFRQSGKTRRYAWDYDDWFDVWVKDLATGEQRNLTQAKGYDAEGSYSPDGEWIVFASNRHAFEEELSQKDRQRFEVDRSLFLDIYRMRSDGSEVERLTTARGYDGGPFYSYDGEKICWRRFNEHGTQAEIMTMNADGSGKKQLTDLGAMSWAPFFHPSGEYLIFTTNRHGFANFELYLVDAQGRGEPVRVTWTAGFDGLPTFTPDGETLSWTTNRTSDGSSQIWVGDWHHETALEMLRATIGDGEEVPVPETEASVRAEDLEAWVHALVDPHFEGRALGTAGEHAAFGFLERALRGFGFGEDATGASLRRESFTFTDPESGRELTGQTLFARLPAAKSSAGRPLFLGAHVDGLGRGKTTWQPVPEEQENRLHPGANANASGVATLLEAAERLARWKAADRLTLERDLVFVFWSGGAWNAKGSRHYVGELIAEKARRAKAGEGEAFGPLAYVDVDTVGRLDERLFLTGVGTSPGWKRLIERGNAPVGLDLEFLEGALPGDARSFAFARIPSLSLFTGADPADGTPEDTADRLDYAGLAKVARFTTLLARAAGTSELAMPFVDPETVAEEEAERPRGGGRPWLGTIPDYAPAPIPGLRLSGVAPGGPAAQAGLRGGDVIVHLAGEDVTDIQDYAKVIDELEVGTDYPIRFVRDGETKSGTITPRARQ